MVCSLGNPGGIVAYLDNILLHSKNVNTHLDLMEKIFEVHFQAGIVIKDKKTFLLQCKVAFLGFEVYEKGIRMTDKALTRIANGPIH